MQVKNRPFISIWFGNFFEPFYGSREAVRDGIAEIAGLSFASLNLDSKPREDFFARYRGEPASPCVAMQGFMLEEAIRPNAEPMGGATESSSGISQMGGLAAAVQCLGTHLAEGK